MLKRFVLLCAIVATALVATAGASASSGNSKFSVEGFRCVKAGVTFLAQNNLLLAAATRQIDYDTIDSDSGGSEGAINTDLPANSFLPLSTVISLHYTNPELFDWCAR